MEKIEHRLFRRLAIVEPIGGTTSKTSLKVECALEAALPSRRKGLGAKGVLRYRGSSTGLPLAANPTETSEQ